MPEHTLAAATLSGRYTELPKISELVTLGVRPELVSTYAALADFSNNRTGECYPQMRTLAGLLGRSVRTVQRHLHELADFGLIEFVARLRDGSGRYKGYLYRMLHTARIAERRGAKKNEKQEAERRKGIERSQRRRSRFFKKQSSGHQSPVREDRGTTTGNNYPPNPPAGDFKEGYEWLFGETPDPVRDEERRRERQRQRQEESRRRREGYEWFFE